VTGHGYPVVDSNPQVVLARSNSRKWFFKPLLALYSLLQRNFSDHRHSFGVFASAGRLSNCEQPGLIGRVSYLAHFSRALLHRPINAQSREELTLNSLPS